VTSIFLEFYIFSTSLEPQLYNEGSLATVTLYSTVSITILC